MRHKIDIDKLQMDIMRNNVKPYICDVPGCGNSIIWYDKDREIVSLDNKMVNVGTGMGLVYSTCEHCGKRVCPHPSMKPLNGLPPFFCATPPRPSAQIVRSKIWTPNSPYNYSRDDLKQINFGGNKSRMNLPGDFADTKHCLVEAFYFDHADNLQTISCCQNRECQKQFEDDSRQIRRKAFHGA